MHYFKNVEHIVEVRWSYFLGGTPEARARLLDIISRPKIFSPSGHGDHNSKKMALEELDQG